MYQVSILGQYDINHFGCILGKKIRQKIYIQRYDVSPIRRFN